MIHPNMFLNQTEINTIKARINTNQEPWKTAFNKLRDVYVPVARNTPIQSVTFGGPTPPSGDIHDYYSGLPSEDPVRYDYNAAMKIRDAVRNLGLYYALTGDSSAADKAIQLINGWCVNPTTRLRPRWWYSGQNGQVWIELSITMPGLFYGADLIWNYPGWLSSDKNTFIQWTKDLLSSRGRIKDTGAHNYENWKLVFMSSAAIITEDNDTLNWVFPYWKELIPIQIQSNPLGRIDYEWTRGWPINYSTYAINAMLQTAEIARHHPELGYDLYNYKLNDGTNRGLQLILDIHAPFVADQTKWTWTKFSCRNCEPTNAYRCCSNRGGSADIYNALCNGSCAPNFDGQNAAIYEIAISRYGDKTIYRAVINKWGRPMYEIRNMGPITLTHGSSFETIICNIPISRLRIT